MRGSNDLVATSANLFRYNRVDIYIRECSGKREIRVPWLPKKIDCKSGGTIFASYDIINKGEVAVPTGSELAVISWDSVFPGVNRTDQSMMRGPWKDPSVYHNILEDWKKNKTKLNVMVTGFPINMDVYLKEYNPTPSGGFGDMEYDVSFIEARGITIKTTTEKQRTQTEEPKRSVPETTAYTIKKGDCLWSISQRFLGAGSRWNEIYDLNKDIIESTAKKYGRKNSSNGHWIYPGVTIQIPKK